jgi:hypothetical protein
VSYRLAGFLIILALALVLPAHAQTRSDTKTTSRDEQAVPVSVLSIIPAQAEPGMSISLSGNGFSASISAFLGNVEIPAQLIDEKQISFTLPDLAPGLYALFLKREDGVTSRTYTFTVLPLKPVATDLSPDTIYACSTGKDREVQISGHSFKEKSVAVLDGAAVKSRYLGPENIAFTVPQIPPGLHQVQVKSPPDAVSGALALIIDGRPEITGISRGEEYVNFYNLYVDGRNFQQNSVLVITEESSLDLASSPGRAEVKRLRAGSYDAERERVIFSSCNRLIYQRHPYSTTLKNFQVQVVNPNGEESASYSVGAP